MKAIIFSIFLAQLAFATIKASSKEPESDGVQLLLEYKKVLPKEAFAKLIEFYSNQSLTLIERERKVVDYFSSNLSRDVKAQLPVPFGFRKLPIESQEKAKLIYYQDGMDYEEKLMRIGVIITQNTLPEELNAMRNGDKSGLGLIEFRVNVSLMLNGFYTMAQLKSALTAEEFEKVEKISASSSPGNEKSTAIGQVLRDAYNRNPDHGAWPSPFGTSHLSADMKKATSYMLFSKDPSKDLAPFVKVFKQGYLDNPQLREQGMRRIKREIRKRIIRADRRGTEMILYDRPQ